MIASLNFSKFTVTSGSNPTIKTFQLGGILETHIYKNIQFQTGLSICEKGAYNSYHPGYNGGTATTIHLLYLEAPINVVIELNSKKKYTIIGGAGFYLAQGISGSEKGTNYDSIMGNYSFYKKVKFTNKIYSYSTDYIPLVKPFDYGFNLLIGIQLKRIRITSEFSRGLIDITPGYKSGVRNSIISISLTYFFKKL